MKQTVSNTSSRSLYYRLTLWSCKAFARFATLLAMLIVSLTRALPEPIRMRGEASSRLLKNMAVLVVQPSYIRNNMRPGVALRAMIDGFLLGALIGATGGFYIENALLLLVVITLALLVFSTLVNFLSLSGDLYLDKQDEFQKAVSHQASAYTLKVVIGLLIVLLFGYLFFRTLRVDAFAHVCIVLFVARLTYLIRLASLRWQEMVQVDLEDGIELVTE